MLHKPWKTIERDNGKVAIYGNHHVRPILSIWELEQEGYDIPDWIEPEDYDFGYQFFVYLGDVFCLSEVESTMSYAPDWLKEFDGVQNDTFFSGILIKLAETPESYGDIGVKVYTFIS